MGKNVVRRRGGRVHALRFQSAMYRAAAARLHAFSTAISTATPPGQIRCCQVLPYSDDGGMSRKQATRFSSALFPDLRNVETRPASALLDIAAKRS